MGFSQRREDGEVRGREREKIGKRAEIEGRRPGGNVLFVCEGAGGEGGGLLLASMSGTGDP